MRSFAGVATGLLLALLQACGGAAGDAESPAAEARLPELSGRVSNGATATQVATLQITVKGQVGTARTAEGRSAAVAGGDYLASLDQLSGPYLLSDSALSPSSLSLYSVATRAGTANLTPLSTLLVAELLGTEPGPYFEALGTRGGFTAADDAAVAAAEQRVRRYLKREFGFEIPASVSGFASTPFARTVGDPMYDTLTALVARVGSGGDIGAVVAALGQESGRCKLERVDVVAAAGSDDLCPFSKTNEADADDAGVRVLRFVSRRGDVLSVRLRGTVVLQVQRVTAEGVSSACEGAACTGVSVGTPAGDQTQTIALAATPLLGSGGSQALTGTLRTSAPGISLPGLPCTSNRFYLIHTAAGSAEGYCASGDDFGLGTAGQSQPSGETRRNYTFSDGMGGPSLEVVTQGSTVLRALVYTVYANSGSVARYQCRGDCTGVSLGATRVDQSLGVPVLLQPVRFDRAVLAAVLPDGSLSSTDSVTVEATLTSFYVNDPATPVPQPVACAPGAALVLALPSDQGQPVPVCEPADTQGFTLRYATLDADGNTSYLANSLLSDGFGGYAMGNGIAVTLSPTGALLSVSFEPSQGPRYQCLGAACAGVSLGSPDGLGERSIGFNATVLQEVGSAGLPADRRATLNGSMIATPPS
ncbi:hypothetical protein [Aquabacterium sp. OR-4]|uniref:hypothetical protein n=1 Tax=Aquabacterium sp. OR-4 TaxID=2978127 RepID=UPI0021B3B5E7|nr:hypothetical protein [Aquabacterium sp. OR-4]MDT7838412.1 hypothetical protein [Aquabacterium sp. OR-4]